MALDLGTLVAKLKVDASEYDAGLDQAEGKGKSWSGAMGKVMAAGGAAGGLLFGVGLAGGMELEGATDRVGAALGLTEQQSARVGRSAGELYANAYGESMGDVTLAIEAVMGSIKGMRNASSAELEAVTATAMDFASAMQVDVTRAAQVAGQMLTTGLAKDATEAFDLLTAASQKVPAALREDLLDATDEYGQFFAQLGISGEQAMGMLAAASEKGMYGIDKTGDAIKEFTIRATDMSTASVEAYDAIGLSAKDMTNDLLAGGDRAAGATQKIIDGILGIKDPAKQSQAALALFGTPLEDLSTKDIPKFLQSLKGGKDGLGDVAGAAERAGQQLNDNASTNLRAFGRTLRTELVQLVGGSVLPMVNSLASALATNVGPAIAIAKDAAVQLGQAFAAAGGFIAEHSTVFAVVAGIIAAVFIPHLVALGVAYTVTQAKAAAAWVTTQAGAIKAAAVHSATVVRMVAGWVLMGVQAMLGAARVAAAWLIALGPIGLVIAAVVAVVAAIVMNWDRIKAATAAAWTWVTTKVTAAWSAIKAGVSAAVAAVKAAVTAAWNAIKAATSAVWNAIKGALSAAWGAIKAVVTARVNAVKATVTSVWNAIKSAVTSIMNGLKAGVLAAWNALKAGALAAVNALKAGVSNAFNNAKALVRGAMDAIKAVVTGNLGRVVELFSGLAGRIGGALAGAAQALYGMGKNIVQGLINGVRSMAGAVVDAIVGLLPGPLKKFAGKLGIASPSKLFKQYGTWTGEGYVQGVQGMQGAVESAVEALAVTPDMTQLRTGAPRLEVAAPPVEPAGAAAAGRRAAGRRGLGQLFGDVYVSEQVDVDVLGKRVGFALNGSGLGGGVAV